MAHEVNWYVLRNKKIRGKLNGLWVKGPKNKHTMEGASREQKIAKLVNVLFRNLEKYGPVMSQYTNYKYDKKNDMYHCHVKSSKPTYVVMWEADKQKKLINVVDMGYHENFKYKREHIKKTSLEKATEESKGESRFTLGK